MRKAGAEIVSADLHHQRSRLANLRLGRAFRRRVSLSRIHVNLNSNGVVGLMTVRVTDGNVVGGDVGVSRMFIALLAPGVFKIHTLQPVT